MSSEKKSRPITVEAFRFVQLKNPTIYSGKSFELDFVTHPSPSDSVILKGQLKGFAPYQSLQEVRGLNNSLYAFVFWLKEHRGKFTQEELAEEASDTTGLEPAQKLAVWDNLLYQTQVDSSPAVVEGLIRLLQADHFLQHYTAVLEQYNRTDKFAIGKLYQAAKASVVIPSQLFEQEDVVSQRNPVAMDAKSKTILSSKLDIARLNHQIQQRTKAVEEILAVQQQYIHDNKEEYRVAYQAHQNQIQELIASNTGTASDKTEPSNDEINLPPFTFEPKNTWDDAYLATQLSSASLAIYQQVKTPQDIHIKDTRKAIEKSIGLLSKEQFQKQSQQAPKLLMHQGISIPLRNHPLNNTYVFKALPVEGKNGLYSIYVTQYFETEATKVRQIEATVQTSEGNQYQTTSQHAIHTTDNYVTLQLFPEGISLSKATATFAVTGSFVTEDKAYSSNFAYQDVSPNHVNTATPTQPSTIPTPNIYGLMGVKIAEFKKVNQTLCCYVEGEVSHIENILAREYKERETRNLTRSELTTERSSEREAEKLSDTTSTERHEMQSEISLLQQEDKSTSASASASVGGNYNFGAGGINFNASGSLSTSSASSSSSNFSESESYAKELTQRAMKRLVEKTTYKRTAKMIKEFEETNKHGFDNREGDKHVTGVYRWVDKIYKNELVNYGKRLMYEFTLPEPAKNYKHLLTENLKKGKGESCDSLVLQKPLSPTEQGVQFYHQINEWNFDSLVAYYGLEVEEYPVQYRTIAKSFSENFYHSGGQINGDKRIHASKDFDFELPKDYRCTDFNCQFVVKRHGDLERIHGDLLIGDVAKDFHGESVYNFRASSTTSITIGGTPLIIGGFTPVEDYLPIALAGEDIGPFAMTVWAKCELKTEAFDEFRLQLFAAMWVAYKEMLLAYNDAQYEHCQNKQLQAASNESETPNYNFPSAMARSIEKREIKRLIIEQMMQKIYQSNIPVTSQLPIGFNYYEADHCNNTLNLSHGYSLLKDQMRYAKFLEEAFEWEIMAYNFMPYYWGDEKEWGDLLSIDAAADHIFLAFLQSGMANIILPVKPDLEKSVAFLLETGKLWRTTGFIVDGQDDLYPAIEQQLQIEVDADGNEIKYDAQGNPIPVVESTWETRVPSTLTIVQDYSNPLDEQGLPCFCEKDKTNVIGYSPTGDYNTLKGKTE